jgi:hypothetical protein
MTDHPLVPSHPDTTVHLVLDCYGALGCAYVETDPAKADFDTIVRNLISGEYRNPARVIAFNYVEGWSHEVSEDVARAMWERQRGEPMERHVRDFIERHMDFPMVVV